MTRSKDTIMSIAVNVKVNRTQMQNSEAGGLKTKS